MKMIKILLVEDDAGHARLIEKNLFRAGVANEIAIFNNGQSVLDYLKADDLGVGTVERLLILLDLNLPVLSGYEVLAWLKGSERTKKIPVIVLTTTDLPQEITKCYELGCNLFITKPVQYDEFCNTIRSLGLLLSIVKTPLIGARHL
jgi:CheY-like chemotaxis protein